VRGARGDGFGRAYPPGPSLAATTSDVRPRLTFIVSRASMTSTGYTRPSLVRLYRGRGVNPGVAWPATGVQEEVLLSRPQHLLAKGSCPKEARAGPEGCAPDRIRTCDLRLRQAEALFGQLPNDYQGVCHGLAHCEHRHDGRRARRDSEHHRRSASARPAQRLAPMPPVSKSPSVSSRSRSRASAAVI
jgi:hypothetical protein